MRPPSLSEPGWEIGMELAAGWHSGFAQVNGPRVPSAAAPSGGSDVDACFSARSAPGMPRFNWCVVGIGFQSQVGAPSILWFYTEPRVRIFGKAAHGRSNWELGGLFRFGAGSISRSSTVPFILAPGVYVARHIRTNSTGSGWSVQASYSRGSYFGFKTGVGGSATDRPKNTRFTLGLGWYQ